MKPSVSPTPRLLVGLAITLLATGIFSWYALHQIQGLRQLQSNIIDRNRKDTLQLLRIQNNLSSLALAMRDMVDGEGGYPLEAWRNEFARIREDLMDGVNIESKLAARPADQEHYLTELINQFWVSSDQAFTIAQQGDPARARRIIANSLQAQQAAMSATVARLLVQNNEGEEQAFASVQRIYGGVERNIYFFVAAMLTVIVATSLSLIYFNRRIFDQLAALSGQKSTLARKLIGVQEEVLRSVSRELHDDFGQILTAIGVMLGRAEKKGLPADSPLRSDVDEVREIVQSALEKTRSLSQALHPAILDDYGLEKAMDRFVPAFEKQTGISVEFSKQGSARVPDDKAIHIYRIMQEALNNVARHSRATSAWVRVRFGPGLLNLEVEDRGVGIPSNGHRDSAQRGLGLIAMRERAELLHGSLSLTRPTEGGTLVTLSVPLPVPSEKP